MMQTAEPSPAPPPTDTSIEVTVLLFSVLREAIGQSTLNVDLSANATVADLLDRLSSAYSAVRDYRTSLRVGVNAAYAEVDQTLAAGDEVALITPVSGG